MLSTPRLLLICLILLFSASQVQAEFWPRESRVPGGIAILEVPQRSEAPPHVYFQEERVYTARKNGSWYAWVGIPLSQKPGDTQAYWRTRDGDLALDFSVSNKEYPAQHLDVDYEYVALSDEDLARYRRELPELRGAMDHFRPVAEPLPEKVVKPLDGRYSSLFGFRRVFNGEPRNPHSGLDIAAPQGAPIQAALPGKVAAKNHYFFNGKTLVIDHGQGMTSMYCHMHEFADLQIGDRVEAGQVIGQVGTTGRSTGPHLHWTMSLNTARVEPKLFLDSE
ncbi:peptidoglycan DD-metalloendopeptidase family protein [Marinospirillum sp.]|uniref:peptidoglycan DD-metalloendopeptidase family protein n=1 Tax=Marinospirillum sp. TaxID=2183934 RepID=UPI00287010E3|nr:peptidoglycan DD-metalloendopeptidase family protein [Marinospirillum sp.]MDR9466955.1 peptidoglycan DD-metalloendopeptidase family protein [Marinospirillum sp.]